jgi:hypothetical protein
MRRPSIWITLASTALALAACGNTVNGTAAAGGGGNGSSSSATTASGTTSVPPQNKVDKIDLVLAIDNSRSMADKQQILSYALTDLVASLVNPACRDPNGVQPPVQTASPTDPCPAGFARDFAPVTDIHIGVITSSLGGHGADACPETDTIACPAGVNTSEDDHGHLVTRTDPCSAGSVPTYQNRGFLAWDPLGKDSPPGEKDVGQIAVDTSTGQVTTVAPGLVPALKDLVLGVGQIGCGYESQLESWYRFLADPEPYESIVVDPSKKATPVGIDNVLLAQRADFLRADSMLGILLLTDENDCSIKEYGQFYLVAQQRDPANPNNNFHLPKPRSECATNPNDKCCVSCGQATPAGCPPDPGCQTGTVEPQNDDVNLRCWDQKRRFGIDFLYPIDRYVTALTQHFVPNRKGDMVPNPIFSNLNPTVPASSVRDPGLVVFAGIVGVPWQDLARDPKDLGKGFMGPPELVMKDSAGHTRWDYILGDPANYVAPLDPHMIESNAPRAGTNPITGDQLAPPSMTEGGPDAINGHEYTPGTKAAGGQVVQGPPNDLEYACIFTLPQPRDCSDPTVVSCDCQDYDSLNDKPLCAANGAKGRTLQTHAKAYPGIRQLQLVKELGTQGVAGSICPAQLADPSRDDFGYRPSIRAFVEALSGRLQ